jgi:ADP-heptose:LPS heptosyltransferase
LDGDSRVDRMKILVVSLLRLGDILLSTSVLRSLRHKFPNAEIHILINGQFSAVAEMIPSIDKVFTFDREALQEIIGSPDRNLLEAYFRVEDLGEKLKSEKYDKVINLTHNRLSGWITAFIACPDTRGVMFGAQGKFSVGSKWFDYLNDFVDAHRTNTFHFVDVFHYGAGIATRDRRIILNETSMAKDFAKQVIGAHSGPVIAIQPFSAEVKKTFNFKKWAEIISLIKKLEPTSKILILGAPNEKYGVSEISKNSDSVEVICTLSEAFSILNRVQLLITGDTSIKHMAASVSDLKVLEISLGSSEYLKTGVYKEGSVIIQGLAPCAPCSHRTLCTQPTHLCGDHVSSDLVAMAASSILRHDELGLRTLAYEDRKVVTIARTHISNNGDWSAYPLGHKLSASEINSWVDRASFKLYLEGSHSEPVGEFGTEGLHLKSVLENMFPENSKFDWSQELGILENGIEDFEEELENYLNRLKLLLADYTDESKLNDYIKDLEGFCLKTAGSHFSTYSHQILWSLKDSQTRDNTFEIIKNLREKLSHAHQRTKIEIKLIRGLQTQFKEAP